MKRIRSRLGYKSKFGDFGDARDLLEAKRSVNRRIVNQFDEEDDSILEKSDTNFTIPVKTISNDKFTKKIPKNDKISNNNLNLMNHNNPRHKFRDLEGSRGIIVRNIENQEFNESNIGFETQYLETYDHSSSFNRKRAREDFRRPINDNNNSFLSDNEPRIPLKRSVDSEESYRIDFPRRTPHRSHSPDVLKKSAPDNLEKVKFVVVQDEKKSRPPLSTAKMSHKSSVSPLQGYRLEVKNLHPQVNVDDVLELFSSLDGDVRSCNLVRVGFAEVLFRKLVDAQKCIDEFHGRELDGKPMHVKLMTPAEEPPRDSLDPGITSRIGSIQSRRKRSGIVTISREAIFRSMFMRSMDTLDPLRKPFKFSVTM